MLIKEFQELRKIIQSINLNNNAIVKVKKILIILY